jgi:hypothetical protein
MKPSEIKKHVTHFSLELPQANQEEDVVVGGELKAIIPPADEQNPMFILILDDHLGPIHVFVSDRMFTAHSNHLRIGSDVFIEGYVNFVSRKHGKQPDKEVFVYGYGIKQIKEEQGAC